MLKDRFKIRPEGFRLNYASPLAQGLVFAGLGAFGSQKPGILHDSSHFHNHGTLTSMDPATDWVWVPELGRWALDFDGSDDQIAVDYTVLTNIIQPPLVFSVAQWIYADVAAAHGDYNASFSFGGTDDLLIYPNENDSALGYVGIRVYWKAAAGSFVLENAATRTGLWFPLCFTTDGNTHDHRLYARGTVVDTSTASPNDAGPCNSMRIGGSADDSQPFDGKVADTLLFRRVLTPLEISSLADPSNVMLEVGGVPLLLPPRRKWWSVGAIAGGWMPIHTRRGRVITGA